VIALVVGAAIVVAVTLFVTTRADSPDYPTYRTDALAGRRFADQACDALDDFVALVNDNGRADTATALLKTFESKAQSAYDADVAWTRLLSAAKALRAGFKADDAEVTRVGYDLAREECRR
jgi:hypothetical protein